MNKGQFYHEKNRKKTYISSGYLPKIAENAQEVLEKTFKKSQKNEEKWGKN